jgi:DNA-binding protein HU-beta
MAKAAKAGGKKAMSKSEVAGTLAERVGISKKQAAQFLQELSTLAYQQARNSFLIPGIGKLVMAERPARSMIMRFGPKAGQTVQVPAKKVLKFRVAKAAKDAVLGAKK